MTDDDRQHPDFTLPKGDYDFRVQLTRTALYITSGLLAVSAIGLVIWGWLS